MLTGDNRVTAEAVAARLGIDPGHRTDCPAHHVTLGAGLWHLEGVVGLHQVPSRGALLFAAVLPLVDGSGAPARVFALVPAE